MIITCSIWVHILLMLSIYMVERFLLSFVIINLLLFCNPPHTLMLAPCHFMNILLSCLYCFSIASIELTYHVGCILSIVKLERL